MNKIIAAFDGLKYSTGTRDYAVYLAKHSGAHLVGVFLDDFSYTSYRIYDLVKAEGGIIGSAKKKLDKKDVKSRAAAISDFTKACQDAGLEYTIHRDKNVAIHELLHESIYADLLLIDGRETLSNYPEKPPTRFIRDLLSHVQCPVMVLPRIFKPVKKLVLLYDGEPSSVHAIKMFSYTLPFLKQCPTEALSVNLPAASLHVPDNTMVKEFMKRHFPECQYTVLRGIPEIQIMNHLKEQQDASLVVLGAYRRGMVSRWFRASMADALMQNLKMPLFIAHNK